MLHDVWASDTSEHWGPLLPSFSVTDASVKAGK